MNIAHRFTHLDLGRRSVAQALRTGTVLTALVVTAAAAPALAAEPAQGPIEIRACAPVYGPATEQVYAMGITPVIGVEIDYVNHAAVPAEDVSFQVGDGPTGMTLADYGTFAPGTLIRRVFWTSANPDTNACSVTAARFNGGTAYDAHGSSKNANR